MGRVHAGALELYQRVANWENCPVPISKEFGWSRWGLMGALADFILYSTPGDICEVGICESSIFFTFLAKKYNRKAYHCDIQWSDIENCLTVPGYFDENSVIVVDSSDNFFANTKFTPIALGFIDGEHTHGTSLRDFWNIYEHLVPDGYVFLHDTYPKDKNWLDENACGDVYLTRQALEKDPRLDVFTFTAEHTAWGTGLTLVRKKPENLPYYKE